MTVRIVTDSTCDLPSDVAAQLGIEVVPLYINFGDTGYLDGVEMSREEFYARLPDCDPPPTTAVPGPHSFLRVYERLAEEGATEIVSIHISESLSGTVNVARVAAREFSAVPVTVIDSTSLTMGTGFLAWRAAQAAADGHTAEEIVAITEEQSTRTHVFAVIDTLEFLRRSGRMNGVVAKLGGWLNMKPLLRMHLGKPVAEKVLIGEAAVNRLITLVRDLAPLEKVALVHTHALEHAESLRKRAAHLLPRDGILSMDITPVFGAHLGPGAVGFALVSSRAA